MGELADHRRQMALASAERDSRLAAESAANLVRVQGLIAEFMATAGSRAVQALQCYDVQAEGWRIVHHYGGNDYADPDGLWRRNTYREPDYLFLCTDGRLQRHQIGFDEFLGKIFAVPLRPEEMNIENLRTALGDTLDLIDQGRL